MQELFLLSQIRKKKMMETFYTGLLEASEALQKTVSAGSCPALKVCALATVWR